MGWRWLTLVRVCSAAGFEQPAVYEKNGGLKRHIHGEFLRRSPSLARRVAKKDSLEANCGLGLLALHADDGRSGTVAFVPPGLDTASGEET